MENNFDLISSQTIEKLEREFQVKSKDYNSINCPKSVGIEIEVKFKYYFPELHKKYFSDFAGYKNLPYSEQTRIKLELSEAERPLQDRLFKTIECGIPHGMDKYWEFAFRPAYDLSLLCKQVDILNQANLIPIGKHSLHINIGDQRPTPRIFWILNVMELLFCTKERIESGFSKNFTYMSATWAKKGDGGLLVKNYNDLEGSEFGVEFRTLQFDGTSSKLYEILKTLNWLMCNQSSDILFQLKEKSLSLGLPNSNWGKPHTNPQVWKMYIDNFDELSNFMKNKVVVI